MIGRAQLACDIDERWNGPPPRCDRKFLLSILLQVEKVVNKQRLSVNDLIQSLME